MTGAEWTGFAKLVVEIAGKLKDAVSRSRDHTLSFTALVDLHENLTRFQLATDNLLADRSTPTLTTSELVAQSYWLRCCTAALRALGAVDLAIIRVYSPQLAFYTFHRRNCSLTYPGGASPLPSRSLAPFPVVHLTLMPANLLRICQRSGYAKFLLAVQKCLRTK
jgi:hypothetical protein